LYLKVDWYSSGSVSTNSGVYGNQGYCGDNVDDYAYCVVSFYSDSGLTTSGNLSNIRIYGYGDNSLGLQAVGLTANASLSVGTLTSNQNSVTLGSIFYQGYYPDVTQDNNCTSNTVYAGLRIEIGCSSVSTVTVQQNNTL